MNRFQTISTYSALLLAAFVITGCSSDGDDGGGVSGGGATTVPANAILIDTSATAEQTTASAMTTGTAIVSVFGVETSTILTGKDILNIAMDTVRNENRASPVSAIGVAFSETCSGGGTVTGDETETATSYSATATFTNCVEGDLTLNGTFSVSSTFSLSSGTYSDNASGNLTVTIGSDAIGFNFVYAENGNENTGDYTVTTFNYAINPSAGGGYAVTLTQNLVGNIFLSCELASGQILVTGLSNSQARGTINPDRTLKVEYHSGDGNFVESANSPLACPV